MQRVPADWPVSQILRRLWPVWRALKKPPDFVSGAKIMVCRPKKMRKPFVPMQNRLPPAMRGVQADFEPILAGPGDSSCE
jgi:hypothetical protein